MSSPTHRPHTSDYPPQADNQSGLGEGKILHGIWRIVPSPCLSEMFAQAGLDFQILDCEHGAYDYGTLLPDILACERHGCAPLVRVSGTDRVEVQRCLDLGARGLVFPQLQGPENFRQAAAMMDYPPTGTRGFNPFVRAGNYGTTTDRAVTVGRPWFVPIVETLEAAERIEEILLIERIDLVYIGAYDLSAQLNKTGQMEAPELLQLFDRIIHACAKAGKPVSLMSVSAANSQQLVARGVQALVHGVDSHRMKDSMIQILRPLQDLRVPQRPPPPRHE